MTNTAGGLRGAAAAGLRGVSVVALALAGCSSTPAVTEDAAVRDDASVDASTAPDAFVPSRDWPRSDVPAASEVEAGLRRELVLIPGYDAAPNPTTSDDTPTELDQARFVRYRVEPATEPSAIVIAMPGIFGGAGSFDPLARALVRRSALDGVPIEVWAIDRRSNGLEDRVGLDAAEAESEPDIARGYYFGNDTVGGEAFAGFRAQSDVAYASEWGLETHFGDLRAMIERVPPAARRGHLFLLGHSLGASMTETFAAWTFDDGVCGVDLLAGIVLVDGAAGETPLDETTFHEGQSSGTVPITGLDAIRSTTRYVALPLLGVAVYAEAEIVALDALLTPDAVGEDAERERVMALLFSTRASSLPSFTHRAAFGFAFDDASNGLTFAAASLGHGTGGPTEDYTSLFGSTLLRPSDATATYDWVDALDADPAEYTPIENLAHAWVDGRTNFAEWYFPSRLSLDLAACAGLAAPASGWQRDAGLRCDAGSTMDAPVLAIAAGLRSVASYEASRARGAAIGAGRAHEGELRTTDEAYRVVDATTMTHIDPLTAADVAANPVPTEVLAFVRDNVESGAISGIDLP